MTNDNQKQDYSLPYQKNGSKDITFCAADDCNTFCRRNRILPFFKDWVAWETQHYGADCCIYSVAMFQDVCAKYKN